MAIFCRMRFVCCSPAPVSVTYVHGMAITCCGSTHRSNKSCNNTGFYNEHLMKVSVFNAFIVDFASLWKFCQFAYTRINIRTDKSVSTKYGTGKFYLNLSCLFNLYLHATTIMTNQTRGYMAYDTEYLKYHFGLYLLEKTLRVKKKNLK